MGFAVKNLRVAFSSRRGFTVIEFLIAFTIFMVVISSILFMFSIIGRIYYKNILEVRVRTITRDTVDIIEESIATSGVELSGLLLPHPEDPDNRDWHAYCVGGARYSFRHSLAPATAAIDYSTLKYDYPMQQNIDEPVFVVSYPQGGCEELLSAATRATFANPGITIYPSGTATGISTRFEDEFEPRRQWFVTAPDSDSQVNLLSRNMRLVRFEVSGADSIGGSLATISLKIAYGGDPKDDDFDEEVFDIVDSSTTPLTADQTEQLAVYEKIIGSCRNIQTFCAIYEISKLTTKRTR